MEALLVWLESSSLGVLIRSSGVWIYGIINLAHILSVATLFGSVLLLDLRLLGVWREVSLAALERPTVRLATVGFLGAVASGICLITTNATTYIGNPFVLIKFVAIGFGLANALVLSRSRAWRARHVHGGQRADRMLAVGGGLSLASWVSAAAAGRMIGYW